MSVIAELTIDSGEFVLGRALNVSEDVHVELERVVPSSKQVMPFFWARGGDLSRFRRAVERTPYVKRLVELDSVDDAVLYRAEWDQSVESFIFGLNEVGATILQANGNDRWFFQLRFESHEDLAALHRFAIEHDIDYELGRVSGMTEPQRSVYDFGLSPEQREALELAVNEGYFKVPRETKLRDLADSVGISEQSYSERVRRGIDRILSQTFTSPRAEIERSEGRMR
jgi:predicted DNA binding protein